MPTMEGYLARPLAERLERLRTTPDDLAAATRGRSDAVLSRRPDGRSWSAKEIVCHLRDVEELFVTRFCTMLAMDDPTILTLSATPEALAAWRITGSVGHPLDPERWAEERQYLRNDAAEALAAFRRRRQECLAVLDTLSPAEWKRGGIHVVRGRASMADWAASLAAHDDNHLDQLTRALDGRP
jgi:DinB family protein